MNKCTILSMAVILAISSLVAGGVPGSDAGQRAYPGQPGNPRHPGYPGHPGCYDGQPGAQGAPGLPGRYKRQCGGNWNTPPPPPPPTRPPGYGELLCPKNYWYKKSPSGANCYPLTGHCCC